MNNGRRARLKEACALLSRALSIVTSVKEEEQDSLDNLPVNLQYGERCALMENAIDELEEAEGKIEEATESINNAY